MGNAYESAFTAKETSVRIAWPTTLLLHTTVTSLVILNGKNGKNNRKFTVLVH